MLNNAQIFALLFLMLGPFKILGPFIKITKNADLALTRKIDVRAILFSIGGTFISGFFG